MSLNLKIKEMEYKNSRLETEFLILKIIFSIKHSF
jgi:hypothetical protein